MARPPILQIRQSYNFQQYFELPFEPDDILAELGYQLDRTELDLAQYSGELDRSAKRILQDINLYRVPADLEDLMRILVAILA